jgi:pSer/pThr/pTyr-binding forkhead associated (FHA) protein
MPFQLNLNHLLIVEDDQGRKQFNLDAPVYLLGRDPGCDIRLFSQFVSRRHATLLRVSREDGTYYYRLLTAILRASLVLTGC